MAIRSKDVQKSQVCFCLICLLEDTSGKEKELSSSFHGSEKDFGF
ncbi:Hypothetical protein Minf_0029 [Methylacidiphilum infernorum V4]|uniref:Uncharacterized protein n=1 Tax=Methylacidiphilum infernorum (isolate V4) TaxID=481448 RepID=B3DWJ4_METI4|nr:Hypothetical protein Minf_0029 [Methylacidiphilum infernorum V4]